MGGEYLRKYVNEVDIKMSRYHIDWYQHLVCFFHQSFLFQWVRALDRGVFDSKAMGCRLVDQASLCAQ